MAQASGAAPSSAVLIDAVQLLPPISLALTLNSVRLASISSRVMLLVCCRPWSCSGVGGWRGGWHSERDCC